MTRNHARVIRNTLIELDRSITAIERLMHSDQPEQGVLYAVRNCMSAEKREIVLQMLASLRENLAVVAKRLGLAPEVTDASAHAASLLSLAWTHLEDIRPHKLAAYGSFPPGPEADLLEASVQDMIGRVLDIAHIVVKITDVQTTARKEEHHG
ncbi:MAG: hypothetical protein ACUVRO_02960 [Armatimonadota bacterium]